MMSNTRLVATSVALLFLASCGGGTKKDEKDTGSPGADAGPDTRIVRDTETTPDVGLDTSVSDTEADTMSNPMADWCDRVEPGPAVASPKALPLELSRIHRRVRFFGAHKYQKPDRALADALVDNTDAGSILTAYADALPTVCHVTEKPDSLGATKVEWVGKTAVIRPGKDDVNLSKEADAVVIDLRDLPATPETTEALEKAVSPFIGAPVARPAERVRVYDGMVDEIFSERNVYSTKHEKSKGDSIPSTGSVNHSRIVLRVGSRISPQAASFAAALRQDGYASIVGRSVPTRIAEARWVETPDGGLVFKSRDLLFADDDQDTPIPDVISPDVELDSSAEPSEAEWKTLFDELPDRLAPPDFPAERTMMAKLDPFNDKPKPDYDAGVLRANPIIVHGAAKLFYGYVRFESMALDEELKSLWKDGQSYGDGANDEKVTREAIHRRLALLANEFDDGHGQTGDMASDSTSRTHNPKGVMGIRWEVIGDYPVVMRSTYKSLEPGDKLVEFDGTPIKKFISDWRKYVPAANKKMEIRGIMVRQRAMEGPVNAVFEKPDGTKNQVTLKPVDKKKVEKLPFSDSTRTAGWLNAPNDKIYYVNLDRDAVNNMNVWQKAEKNLPNAEGLVIDMRGYPARFSHRQVLASLTDKNLSWHTFRVPQYRGSADSMKWDESSFTVQGRASSQVADMPVAALVDMNTQSAAENIITPLWMHDVARVFGRRTSASNGNVTGLRLPGMFSVTFTGMDIELIDGRSFHNTGIEPDVKVAPTASAMANGEDPVLDAATKWINNN